MSSTSRGIHLGGGISSAVSAVNGEGFFSSHVKLALTAGGDAKLGFCNASINFRASTARGPEGWLERNASKAFNAAGESLRCRKI